MRPKITLPQLWETKKYISWPHSYRHPVIRVPTPGDHPESHTMQRFEGESELDLFDRCLEYRDKRGEQLWGSTRWNELVSIRKRSVAKYRNNQAGPIPGVYFYARPTGAPVWIATWYERDPTNASAKPKKKSKQFSFGTENARYSTSEQAKEKAIEKRQEEEKKWYSTLGKGSNRRAKKI